jgi:HEAT repeat protein
MQSIETLIELIKDDRNHDEYSDAMIALVEHGNAAVPALIELLDDHFHRWAATRILGDIGPAASAAVPRLIEVLRGVDPGERMHAAQALAKMGPEAKAAVPALLEIVVDSIEAHFIREAAEAAVLKIDPQAAARVGIRAPSRA